MTKPDRIRELRLLYCEFMEEVKRRRDLISGALHGEFDMPKLAAYEFCYLQFRFICELIGLGCLAAHGDIPTSREVHETYQPGRIFSELERLNSDFFPAPGKLIYDGKKLLGMQPISNGALTKEELKILYDRECGTILHKGTMKNLRPRAVDFDRVKEWDTKIVRLLNMHHIKLSAADQQMWVRMIAEDHGGKVAAHLVRASWSGPGPEPPRGRSGRPAQ
jgi:hypothetical protein